MESFALQCCRVILGERQETTDTHQPLAWSQTLATAYQHTPLLPAPGTIAGIIPRHAELVTRDPLGLCGGHAAALAAFVPAPDLRLNGIRKNMVTALWCVRGNH